METTTILIVSSERQISSDLHERLCRQGYRTIVVADVYDDILAKIENLAPDLILIDIHLTWNRGGLKTWELIQFSYNIPVIYLTGKNDEMALQRTRALAPSGFIFLPCDDWQLQATIDTSIHRHRLENQLRESRKWLDITLSSIGEGVIATNAQGVVQFINSIAMELTGWSRPEAIGRPLQDVLVVDNLTSPEYLNMISIPAEADLNRRTDFDGYLISRAGDSIPIEASATLINDSHGKVFGTVLNFRNVAKQRETLQEVKRQAARAEALVQVATQLNKQIELEKVLNIICVAATQALKAKATVVFLLDPEKETFTNMAAYSHSKELDGMEVKSLEIHREQLELLVSSENPVNVIPSLPDFQEWPDWDLAAKFGTYTLLIAALFRRDELIGCKVDELIPEEIAARHIPRLEQVVQTGTGLSFEDENNGNWIINHIYPIKDENGQVTRLVICAQNITERKRSELILQESEARYRAIVEDQTELICRSQPDGTLSFVNEAYCRYFGKSRLELIGQNFSPHIAPEDRVMVDARLLSLSLTNPVVTLEHRVSLEDGEVRWHQWTNMAIFDDQGQLLELASVGRDITDLKKLQEQEREFAAAQERQRLAQDLHDAVNQTLFSARLTSEMLLRQKDTVPPKLLWSSITHIANLIRSGLGEMRILLLELRPESLENSSLSVLLSHLVDALHGRTDAAIEVQIKEGIDPRKEVKIAFYRIAQEALNNIIKHSNCTKVYISLTGRTSGLQLEVKDNGQGFTGSAGADSGMGIKIMYERAGEIGADLAISSQPGAGTTLICNWQPYGISL